MSFLRSRIVLCLLGLSLLSATPSFAGFNLIGGGSGNPGLGQNTVTSPSVLLGAEMTLNAFRVVELGVFYDHNVSPSGQPGVNLMGAVARIGFGKLAGLFFDAKAGFSSTHVGFGAGVGLGYHFNDLISIHVGPRMIAGATGTQVLGDIGLMLTL